MKKLYFKKHLFIFFVFFILLDAKAQLQYEINVKDRFPEVRFNFLKMGTNTNNVGDSLTYSSLSLIKNGKPWFPIMGEIHYSRVPEKHWEEELLKMKAGGVEIIATYVLWNHIEATEGHFDWTGNRNLRKFLELCKKHDLYVWMRPGPWCHAEVLYGGFPTWLVKKNIGLRKNDPVYLQYVGTLFKEIFKQCDGMLYKQGGPLIATQIENELHFDKNRDAYLHCLSLKKTLVKIGFDLPYYSVFARENNTQNEFLVTLGGYPDSPWSQNTNIYYKPVYFIRPFEMDGDIGTDLFGKYDGKIRDRLPKIGAEMAGGMQETYHRRVKVSADDIMANLFVKIASGLNGIGYYMYHGGENPLRESGLQESRVTEYPNDLAIVDYDFQAPIGAMGIVHDHYYKAKSLHLFLNEYGDALTQMNPSFTTAQKMGTQTIDTVQASLRQKNGSGFLFLSNYQRHVDNPTVQNFQLTINGIYGKEKIPQNPIQFPANSFAVWPYHQNIEGNKLVYATVQPLTVLRNADEKTYFYFSSEPCEFLFDSALDIQDKQGFTVNENSLISHQYPAWVSFKSANGTNVRIVVLSAEMAYKSNKITLGNTEYLIMGNGVFTKEDGKLVFETTKSGPISTYPALKLQHNEILSSNTKDIFNVINLKKHLVNPKWELVPSKPLNDSEKLKAKYRKDSVLKFYATSKQFNPKQPGPIYGLKFYDLPGEKVYSFSGKFPTDKLVKDWIIDLNYLGDAIALYQNDSIIYDQFNYQNLLQLKAGYFSKNDKLNFKIQTLPYEPQFDIYVDEKMKPFLKSWEKPLVSNIKAKPLLRYEFGVVK